MEVRFLLTTVYTEYVVLAKRKSKKIGINKA